MCRISVHGCIMKIWDLSKLNVLISTFPAYSTQISTRFNLASPFTTVYKSVAGLMFTPPPPPPIFLHHRNH